MEEFIIDYAFLKGKIGMDVYEHIEKKRYKIVKVDPYDLITSNRLDLQFKICYLKLKNLNPLIATDIYKQDLKIVTLGSYSEKNDNNKNTFLDFVSTFDNIYKSLSIKDFDYKESIIPLANDGSILNGSHRVSAAYVLSKSVWAVKTELSPIDLSYKTYKTRGADLDILEYVIKRYIYKQKNIYAAFIWPSISSKRLNFMNKFKNIIYTKSFELNSLGKYNLLHELYKHMNWIGTKKNHYYGLVKKYNECFSTNNPIHLIIFKEDEFKEVLKIKSEIRIISNIRYSAIHITDNDEQTREVVELLFNVSGLLLLENSKNLTSRKIKYKLNQLQKYCNHNNLNIDEILVNSGFVLEIYGLRDSDDIDIITLKDTESTKLINNHNSQKKYLETDYDEIISNYKKTFYFRGFNFINLETLYNFKRNRGEKKDIYDMKIISNLLKNNATPNFFRKYKYTIKLYLIRLKQKFFELVLLLLKKLKLYKIIKKIYKLIKKY